MQLECRSARAERILDRRLAHPGRGDASADPLHRQVAGDGRVPVFSELDVRRFETDLGVVVAVEEVCSSNNVLPELGRLADRDRVGAHGALETNARAGRIQPRLEAVERRPEVRHLDVPYAEDNRRVNGIRLVRAGELRRDCHALPPV